MVIASLEFKLVKSDEQAVKDSEKIETLTYAENKLVDETNESKRVIDCLEHYLETCN